MTTDAFTLTRQYDRVAATWTNLLQGHGYSAAYDWLADRVCADRPEIDARAVCDLGCGTGALGLAMARRSGGLTDLTLVDPSRAMLDIAARNLAPVAGRVTPVQAHLSQLAPEGSFTLILAAHVVEHCDDLDAAFRQIRAMLAPGGTALFVISRPHICQWAIWLRWRHRWFSPDRVTRGLRAAGFGPPAIFAFPHGIPRRTSLAYLCTPERTDQC